MRADRLLSILLLLHVHRRMTDRDLATRLEVTERTIYRDMDALAMAGVPVYTERGTGGGCFLPDGYQAKLTGLSQPEIQALLVAKPEQILADLGLQNTYEGALLRLLASVTTHLNQAATVQQYLHIDVSGWNQSGEKFPHLRHIAPVYSSS